MARRMLAKTSDPAVPVTPADRLNPLLAPTIRTVLHTHHATTLLVIVTINNEQQYIYYLAADDIFEVDIDIRGQPLSRLVGPRIARLLFMERLLKLDVGLANA